MLDTTKNMFRPLLIELMDSRLENFILIEMVVSLGFITSLVIFMKDRQLDWEEMVLEDSLRIMHAGLAGGRITSLSVMAGNTTTVSYNIKDGSKDLEQIQANSIEIANNTNTGKPKNHTSQIS